MNNKVQFVRDNAMSNQGGKVDGRKTPFRLPRTPLYLFSPSTPPPPSCCTWELISHKYVALAYDDRNRLDDHRSKERERDYLVCEHTREKQGGGGGRGGTGRVGGWGEIPPWLMKVFVANDQLGCLLRTQRQRKTNWSSRTRSQLFVGKPNWRSVYFGFLSLSLSLLSPLSPSFGLTNNSFLEASYFRWVPKRKQSATEASSDWPAELFFLSSSLDLKASFPIGSNQVLLSVLLVRLRMNEEEERSNNKNHKKPCSCFPPIRPSQRIPPTHEAVKAYFSTGFEPRTSDFGNKSWTYNSKRSWTVFSHRAIVFASSSSLIFLWQAKDVLIWNCMTAALIITTGRFFPFRVTSDTSAFFSSGSRFYKLFYSLQARSHL